MRVQGKRPRANGMGEVGGGGGGRVRVKVMSEYVDFSFGFQRNLRYYSYLVVYLDDCMAITARSENRFSPGVFRHC